MPVRLLLSGPWLISSTRGAGKRRFTEVQKAAFEEEREAEQRAAGHNVKVTVEDESDEYGNFVWATHDLSKSTVAHDDVQ